MVRKGRLRRADHRGAEAACRRGAAEKARQIQAALRRQQLAQPEVVAAAYAATVGAAVAVIRVLNEQAAVMEVQVESHFGSVAGMR